MDREEKEIRKLMRAASNNVEGPDEWNGRPIGVYMPDLCLGLVFGGMLGFIGGLLAHMFVW
jgi:hypothetical protein